MLRRFRGSPALLPPDEAEAEAAESGTEDAVQLLDILEEDEEDDDFGASVAAAAFSGSKSSSKTREERTSL